MFCSVNEVKWVWGALDVSGKSRGKSNKWRILAEGFLESGCMEATVYSDCVCGNLVGKNRPQWGPATTSFGFL